MRIYLDNCCYNRPFADAIHLASAAASDCDWFITVDKGILKKVKNVGRMRVANPLEYIQETMP